MAEMTSSQSGYRLLTTEQEAYLRLHPPGEAIIHALRVLLECDARLLDIDANERSITFRFAMYLQSQLTDWEVDCEFNRDGVEPKRLGHLELYRSSKTCGLQASVGLRVCPVRRGRNGWPGKHCTRGVGNVRLTLTKH